MINLMVDSVVNSKKISFYVTPFVNFRDWDCLSYNAAAIVVSWKTPKGDHMLVDAIIACCDIALVVGCTFL